MNEKRITKTEFDLMVPEDLKPGDYSTEVTPGGVYVTESWYINGRGARRVSLQGAEGYIYYAVDISIWTLLNPITWIRFILR